MPSRRTTTPRDATGRKRDQLQKEHAEELQRRESEIGLATASQREATDDVVDLTGKTPQADLSGQPIQDDDADAFRQNAGRNAPLGATKAPGQAGVSVAADGTMTDTAQPGWSVKTNDKTSTGTGTETPSPVPGGTIADQRVRPTIDTRNATNVGAAGGGPDVEAPRVWTVGDPNEPLEVGGGVQTLEREESRIIRVNTTMDQVTIGAGTSYDFVEGQQYRVPGHVAEYLEELGYVWH